MVSSTNSKQKMIVLSFASLISSFSLAGVTLLLIVTDCSLNLILYPCSALEIISLCGVLLFLVKYVISHLQERSFFQQKTKSTIITVVKSVALLTVACVLFHVIAILFGAPVFQSVAETFHFSILMTTLVAFPCCAVAGPSLEKWIDIFTPERKPGLETVVCLTSSAAVLGAWLGAIPIPLDWDRPWQNWPVTCSVGCVLGYSAGLFLASLYLPHQYKLLSKTKSV